MQRPVQLIAMRMAHHAGPSGYDRLLDFLPGERWFAEPPSTRAQRLWSRLGRMAYQRSGQLWYHREAWLLESRLAWQAMGAVSDQGQCYHFLYGENTYRHLAKLIPNRRNHRLVATFHTPEKRFHEVMGRALKPLKQLDAAITMSSNQVPFLQALMPEAEVAFIPHGIDCNFFTPLAERPRADERLRCLAVGSHLRDYQLLSAAARIIQQRKLPMQLCLITKPEYAALFADLPNTEFLSGLDDQALRQCYQEADLLTLPLVESTANNSLLEAMACGLPILSSDLQGTRDYLTPACASLARHGDVEDFVERLTGFIEHPDRLLPMRQAAREQAETLSWPSVAAQCEALYARLNAQPNRTDR